MELQVTDPLVIYRAKVARGELEEDEEQLRALVEVSVVWFGRGRFGERAARESWDTRAG